MFPSGKVVNDQFDVAYDDREKIYLYNNVGDMFVYDSTLKILAPEKLIGFTISKDDPSNVDWINENCDYVFLRGSNYFHSSMVWPEYTLQNLKKIKVPIVPIGVGFQAAGNVHPQLSEESKEILSVLSHSCEYIGVRGSFSAQCMSDLGIQNVKVIGCPTMFRCCDPSLKVREVSGFERVAFTLRREVSGSYSTDARSYLRTQGSLICEALDRFDCKIVSQGEVDEKIVVYDRPEKEEALGRINATFGFNPDYLGRYSRNLQFFEDIPSYDRFIRSQDLVTGFRLHGNAMALSCGVPTVFVTYDSRTREFVEAFDIPCIDVEKENGCSLDDVLERCEDFSGFESKYRSMYTEFKEFLRVNGVQNRL